VKCRNCNCAKRGYFKSVPEAYVCTGVKEPFVIYNYPDAECKEYKDKQNNHSVNDGVYIELFAIKNGIRYNAKTIEMKDMANILTNSLMDGIEKIWK
jgi:hypothetical protein